MGLVFIGACLQTVCLTNHIAEMLQFDWCAWFFTLFFIFSLIIKKFWHFTPFRKL